MTTIHLLRFNKGRTTIDRTATTVHHVAAPNGYEGYAYEIHATHPLKDGTYLITNGHKVSDHLGGLLFRVRAGEVQIGESEETPYSLRHLHRWPPRGLNCP